MIRRSCNHKGCLEAIDTSQSLDDARFCKRPFQEVANSSPPASRFQFDLKFFKVPEGLTQGSVLPSRQCNCLKLGILRVSLIDNVDHVLKHVPHTLQLTCKACDICISALNTGSVVVAERYHFPTDLCQSSKAGGQAERGSAIAKRASSNLTIILIWKGDAYCVSPTPRAIKYFRSLPLTPEYSVGGQKVVDK